MEKLENTYVNLIGSFVNSQSEDCLFRASELGKNLVKSNISPEEIIQMHLISIEALLKNSFSMKVLSSMFDSFSILLEVMMAYGIAYREYMEEKSYKMEQLRKVNYNLKKDKDKLSLLLEYSKELNKLNDLYSLRKLTYNTLRKIINFDRLEINLEGNNKKLILNKDCYKVPIAISDIQYGSLEVYGNDIMGISESEKQIIFIIANQLAVAIERTSLYNELKILTITDEKTGLYNYKYFCNKLSNELIKAQINKENIALLMIDIDNFKKYNDTCGHDEGDVIINKIGKIFKKEIRKNDIPARFGGEEFVVILPNTDKKSAYLIAERLRKSIIRDIKPHNNFPFNQVTVSIGVSIYPDSGEEPGELIKSADVAMYKAKNLGKNTVVCAFNNTI